MKERARKRQKRQNKMSRTSGPATMESAARAPPKPRVPPSHPRDLTSVTMKSVVLLLSLVGSAVAHRMDFSAYFIDWARIPALRPRYCSLHFGIAQIACSLLLHHVRDHLLTIVVGERVEAR